MKNSILKVLRNLSIYFFLAFIHIGFSTQQCRWPVDFPVTIGQKYSCHDCIDTEEYHAGLDLTSTLYNATDYDTPVRAVADGFVEKIFMTLDTNSRCVHITVDC